MKKLKARLGLKLVGFGLFIMSLGDKSEYDQEDHDNLKKLHILKFDFEEALK